MNVICAIARVVIIELYRRKDFYVLFVLTTLITLILGSMNFFDDDRIVRYLKEMCLLLIWISSLVITVSTTARQIPAERESRTIFPLLAKPVTRGQLVLGKFLGCWLASGIALVVFYGFFIVISASREINPPWVSYLQAAWMHWCMLGILTAMTLWGSLVFAAPSSNATILLILTVGMLLLGQHLSKVAVQTSEPAQTILLVLYYTMPHLDFYDLRDLITHSWGAVPWTAVALASLYALVYMALFLSGGMWSFRRKNLSEKA
jgi:Cu-processing system permease protein